VLLVVLLLAVACLLRADHLILAVLTAEGAIAGADERRKRSYNRQSDPGPAHQPRLAELLQEYAAHDWAECRAEASMQPAMPCMAPCSTGMWLNMVVRHGTAMP